MHRIHEGESGWPVASEECRGSEVLGLQARKFFITFQDSRNPNNVKEAVWVGRRLETCHRVGEDPTNCGLSQMRCGWCSSASHVFGKLTMFCVRH